MKCEGGYQGRTNKLVDACYSFWQGSIPIMISMYARRCSDAGLEDYRCCVHNSLRLQQYILHCSQQFEGGLRDKPGKARDHYHTSYSLSGLSLMQHGERKINPTVYGDANNLLVSLWGI